MTYAMPRSRKKKRNMEGGRDRYRVTSIRNAISKMSMQCYAMLREGFSLRTPIADTH